MRQWCVTLDLAVVVETGDHESERDVILKAVDKAIEENEYVNIYYFEDSGKAVNVREWKPRRLTPIDGESRG